MVSLDFRDSCYLCIVHNDSVTFCVAVAFVVAVYTGDKFLVGIILCYRTGNNMCRGFFAVKVDFELCDSLLCAVCQQFFANNKCSTVSQFCDCFAVCGVNTADLCCFHFEIAVFAHFDNSYRVHDFFAFAVTVAIVFFNIFYFGIFADEKAVNAVVFAGQVATVVDATACNNHNISIVADVKIVVNHFFNAAF